METALAAVDSVKINSGLAPVRPKRGLSYIRLKFPMELLKENNPVTSWSAF